MGLRLPRGVPCRWTMGRVIVGRRGNSPRGRRDVRAARLAVGEPHAGGGDGDGGGAVCRRRGGPPRGPCRSRARRSGGSARGDRPERPRHRRRRAKGASPRRSRSAGGRSRSGSGSSARRTRTWRSRSATSPVTTPCKATMRRRRDCISARSRSRNWPWARRARRPSRRCETSPVCTSTRGATRRHSRSSPVSSEHASQTAGAEHPVVAAELNNLAEMYRLDGRAGEAEPLYRRALAIQEKALGVDHLELAIVMGNLARLYAGQGKFARGRAALPPRARDTREGARSRRTRRSS